MRALETPGFASCIQRGSVNFVFIHQRPKPPGNSTGVAFETVYRRSRILSDLDEVAVGITHVATPFPAVIVQRLGKMLKRIDAIRSQFTLKTPPPNYD
jgi:hypothetical protein